MILTGDVDHEFAGVGLRRPPFVREGGGGVVHRARAADRRFPDRQQVFGPRMGDNLSGAVHQESDAFAPRSLQSCDEGHEGCFRRAPDQGSLWLAVTAGYGDDETDRIAVYGRHLGGAGEEGTGADGLGHGCPFQAGEQRIGRIVGVGGAHRGLAVRQYHAAV